MSEIASVGAMTVRPMPAPEPARAPADPSSAQARNAQPKPQTTGGVTEVSKELDLAKVSQTLVELAKSMPEGSKLSIRRDAQAARFVYEFRDPVSNEVIRRFPAETVNQALELTKRGQGTRVDDRV